MTQDEIIEIYKEVSNKLCDGKEWCWSGVEEPIQLFAKLVEERAVAKEREALTPRCWTTEMNDAWNKAIPDLTLAFDELIRARGQA